MRKPLSLTFRLTIAIGLVFFILFLSFGSYLLYSIETNFAKQDIKKMQTSLKVIKHVLQIKLSKKNIHNDIPFVKTYNTKISLTDRLNANLKSFPGIYANIYDNDIIIYDSENNLLTELINKLTLSNKLLLKNVTLLKFANDDTYRVILLPYTIDKHNINILLALNINNEISYLNRLRTSLITIAILSVIFLSFLIPFAIYKANAPLREISEKIGKIDSDNLDTRLLVQDTPKELQGLVLSFNNMLQKIEEVFKKQANFSADIAHELRTPVTNLITQTQITLNYNRQDDEYREVLYSSLEQYERMKHMINDMLFLAQTDNHLLDLNLTSIDLTKELYIIKDYFDLLAEEKGVSINIQGSSPEILGDRLMLQRAFSNLITNAIRYTPDNNVIDIKLQLKNNMILVCVHNPCLEQNIIASYELDKIFDRFYRLDKSRQRAGDGAGIGLAIVKSVINAHNGSVYATSKDGYTSFFIELPIQI